MDIPAEIDHLIWDWNGTLLNDLEISIRSMNQMLDKRNVPLLDIEKYRSIFTFPVRDYYVKAGMKFDENEWETVAMEFIGNYRANFNKAPLHRGAKAILGFFGKRNIRQYILSAMEQDFLEETLTASGIHKMFDKVVGLNDHYAATKTGNAVGLVESENMNKRKTLMIGDTVHDYEVARAAGIFCILISHGHQSHERLRATGVPVIENFEALKSLFPKEF